MYDTTRIWLCLPSIHRRKSSQNVFWGGEVNDKTGQLPAPMKKIKFHIRHFVQAKATHEAAAAPFRH